MILQDKVAIVTGASSGIGLATAQLLTTHGVKVALIARSGDKLKAISQKLANSYPITADLSDPNQAKKAIQKAVKHFGRVDILINNAGRGYDGPILEIEPKKWQELFNLNLVAPLVAIQQVARVMKQQGHGVIINISSGTTFMNIPGLEAYASLKRALNGLSLTARAELKDSGISVGVVYPTMTATDFYKNKLNKAQTGDKDRYFQGDTPEYVAEKILEAIKNEKAEVKVHDWMGK